MPDVHPTVIAALLTATAAILAALITTWRKSSPSAGPTFTATTSGENSPINQQLIDQSTQLTVTHNYPAKPPSVKSEGSGEQESSSDVGPWVIIAFATCAAVTLVWLMARYWTQIAIAVAVVVAVCLIITASTWLTWRSLSTSSRWLSALIVALSAAVVWAVLVIPTGVGPVKSLPDLAAQTGRDGGSLSALVKHLSIETTAAYTYRLGGLILLILVLVMTTAEGWGMSILAREARRTHPRSTVLRVGARLAGLFDVSPSRIASFTFLAILAVALIHPASLGWLLDKMHQAQQAGVSTR
ncbi:MAG: hypothetical protein M9891_14170 [Austwickia sp.]|nr:hypothetical protein [Actinomycetota bacterium]MCB1253929.1 hypothetical protein [Austwickia sp.]MCO5310399.1 hypothetical protein [Austwickia sp.]